MTYSFCSLWSTLIKKKKNELFAPQDDLAMHNHTQKYEHVGKRQTYCTSNRNIQKFWIKTSKTFIPLDCYQRKLVHDPNANTTSAYGPVKLHQVLTAWIFEVVQDVTLVSQRFNALRGDGDISFRSIRLGEAWAQVRGCAEWWGGGWGVVVW